MELLAPVGDKESLKVAVYNGANAIYLGIKDFNARNNIAGFSLEDLDDVVRFCHLWNVKVYLAINILFKDEELQKALDVVFHANNKGVDAFIVQDVGLAYLINKHYPNIVLHASTQMAVHNLDGVKQLEKLGFKRVVLSREVGLEEIKHIHKNSNIEIEFFVQGALCVSFSGNCYLCSYLANKSGNRGVCQQFCRLPFEAYENNKVIKKGNLLSAKDICLIEKLQDLKEAGVVSLKIEGRARRPFYVGQVCKTYSKVLKNNFKYNQIDINNLKLAFNREFTPAYFNGNANIISKFHNHVGVKIGYIEQVKFGKNFNEVFCVSDYQLAPKSAIKIFANDKEIATLAPHDVKWTKNGFKFTTTQNIKLGDIHLLNDAKIEEEFLSQEKKIEIDLKVVMNSGEKLKFCCQLLGENFEKKYFILEKAKNQPFSEEDCSTMLNRNSHFNFKINLITNGVFVVKSQFNQAKNDFVDNLLKEILNIYEKHNNIQKIEEKVVLKNRNTREISNFAFKIYKSNEEQIDKSKFIIYSPEIYSYENIKSFNEKVKSEWFLDIPNYATSKEVELYKKWVNEFNIGVVVNNIYALDFNCSKIGGSFLNVYNSYDISYYKKFKISKFFIAELNEKEICNLNEKFSYAYREKVFTTFKFCPIKYLKNSNCNNCEYTSDFYYKFNGKKLKLTRKKCIECNFYLEED